MKIRMIASDLDGTLLDHHGQLSERTIAALHRAAAQGVRVTLATGRPYGSTAVIAARIGLEGPVICSNGGLIRDLSGRIYLHRPLGPASFEAVRRMVRELGVRVELDASDLIYITRREDLDRVVSGCRLAMLDDYRDGMPLPEKLFIRSDDPERLEAARGMVRQALGEDLSITSSWADNIEVTRPGVDKGSAVAWLAAHWGISLDEVMVLGDSPNDLSMFRRAGFGVAMANAAPELKALAAAVTGSCQEDGVAQAVERYVLGARAAG